MFRRIELIEHVSAEEHRESVRRRAEMYGTPAENLDKLGPVSWKHGLTGRTFKPQLFDVWGKLNPPRRRLFKNCRFYFTELGWKKYGRPTVVECQRIGQRYRILTIKERSVDVMYRDEFQVAVRPKYSNV